MTGEVKRGEKRCEEEKERGTRRRFLTISLQAGVEGRREKEEVKKKRRYTCGQYGKVVKWRLNQLTVWG